MSNQSSEVKENIVSGKISSSPKQDDSHKERLKKKLLEWRRYSFEMTDFPALVNAIFSDDNHHNIYGTLGIRKLLSIKNARPIQEVIDAKLVPKLIEFMQDGNNPDLQVEATQALGNIACGTTEQTQYLIDKGALPIFVNLLSSPNLDVIDQAILRIINMIVRSPSIRDVVIDSGVLEPLLYLVNHSNDDEIIKVATCAITSLCRGNPPPNFELLKSAIPALCRIIINNTDPITLEHASIGLSFLTRNGCYEIGDDLAKQLIPCLMKYIDNPNLRLSRACLVTLTNLGLSDTNQEIALVDPTYLPRLFKLTCGLNRAVCIAAFGIISNITGGHSNLIQTVIGDHYYVDMLIKFAISDDREVQFEALYALASATNNSTSKQIAEMIDLGVLDCLLYLLNSENTEVVSRAAVGVQNILMTGIEEDQVGRVTNEFLDILRDKGGDIKIEELQTHSDEKISSIAVAIVDTFLT